MGDLSLFLIVPVKLVVYFFVVEFGFRLFPTGADQQKRNALIITICRVMLGILLAVPMWVTGNVVWEALHGTTFAVYITYFGVYGLFRWFAWSISAHWVVPDARGIKAFLIGAHNRDRLWRLVGVAASFALDFPIIAIQGGPMVGKFFC